MQGRLTIAETGSTVELRYDPKTGGLFIKNPGKKEEPFMPIIHFSKLLKVDENSIQQQIRQSKSPSWSFQNFRSVLGNSANGGAYPGLQPRPPSQASPATRSSTFTPRVAPTKTPPSSPENPWKPVIRGIKEILVNQPKALQPYLEARIVKAVETNLGADRSQTHAMNMLQKLIQSGKIGSLSFKDIYAQAACEWQIQAAALISRIQIPGATPQQRQRLVDVITTRVNQEIKKGNMDGSLNSIDKFLKNINSSPKLWQTIIQAAGIYERATPQEWTDPSQQKPSTPLKLPPTSPSTKTNQGTDAERLARENQQRSLKSSSSGGTNSSNITGSLASAGSSGGTSNGASSSKASANTSKAAETTLNVLPTQTTPQATNAPPLHEPEPRPIWSNVAQPIERRFWKEQIAGRGNISPASYFKPMTLREARHEFLTRNGGRGLNPEKLTDATNSEVRRFFRFHDSLIHVYQGNEFKDHEIRIDGEIAEAVFGFKVHGFRKDMLDEKLFSEMRRALKDRVSLRILENAKNDLSNFSVDPYIETQYPNINKELVRKFFSYYFLQRVSLADIKVENIIHSFLFYADEIKRLAELNHMTPDQFLSVLRTGSEDEFDNLTVSRTTHVPVISTTYPAPPRLTNLKPRKPSAQ